MPAADAPPPVPPHPAAAHAPIHVHHHYHPGKSGSTAALLEVIPGLFQVFGIGHIYAGRVGLGLCVMFGYWLLTFINLLLCVVFIGFITWPLCWAGTMILSAVLAANACKPALPIAATSTIQGDPR